MPGAKSSTTGHGSKHEIKVPYIYRYDGLWRFFWVVLLSIISQMHSSPPYRLHLSNVWSKHRSTAPVKRAHDTP